MTDMFNLKCKDKLKVYLFCILFFLQTNHLPNHADSVSSDVLHSVLGLLSNLTYDSSIHETSLQIPISLCDHCYQLLNDSNEVRLQERCMSVLGHVMPNSDDAVNFICKQGGVLKFLKILKVKIITAKLILNCYVFTKG